MLKKLHFKLTMLCTVMTGCILAVLMIVVIIITEQEYNQNCANNFLRSFEEISQSVSGGVVTHNSLSMWEAKDRLLIFVENDSEKALQFPGAWTPRIERSKLLEKAKSKALSLYGIDIKTSPALEGDSETVTFSLKGDKGESYRCAVVQKKSKKDWFSLIVLQDMQSQKNHNAIRRLIFLLIFGTFCVVLYFFSRWFAGKAIEPVGAAMDKQSEFIASVSHELRTPLAVIRSSAGAAENEPENAGRFLKNIDDECERMSHLIGDLLLLASMDSKKWKIEHKTVDLDKLLIDAYELLEPLAAEKKMTLSLILGDELLPNIIGDRERLMQIITILTENAFRYAGENIPVEITADTDDKDVKISVIDHGAGLSSADAKHVFDRFYRCDKSRNDKKGFGLGLSIAKELAELHGGNIEYSPTDGGGCTFTVILPVEKE